MKLMKRLRARSVTVMWVALGGVAAGPAAAESRFGLVESAVESQATAARGGSYGLESSVVPAEAQLTGGAYSMVGGLRSVATPKGGVAPASFSTDLGSISLGACRPNPFSANTSFALSVPRSQQVELNVYDLRGALVKTLVQETIAPGRHVVAWDGRDGAGRRVAKGVYLVRLAARDFHASAKAVFLGEP